MVSGTKAHAQAVQDDVAAVLEDAARTATARGALASAADLAARPYTKAPPMIAAMVPATARVRLHWRLPQAARGNHTFTMMVTLAGVRASLSGAREAVITI